MPRIGVLIHALSPASRPAGAPSPVAAPAFLQGLDLGYVEGRNLGIEWQYSELQADRLAAAVAELARLNVAVIVTFGPPETQAAIKATRSIPIVMAAGTGDPVADGLAASLSRPGGNVTGTAYHAAPEEIGKALELLKEVLPALSRVAITWDLDVAIFHRIHARPSQDAARNLKLTLEPPVPVRTLEDVERAFAAASQRSVGAVFVSMTGVNWSSRDRVVALAVAHRLPTIASLRQWPESGGLMSYGPKMPELFRRAATHVDKILKGAKPGDIPIEQPTSLELVINLKTAHALGLTMPPSVRLRADETID